MNGKRGSLPQTRRGLTLLSQLCRDPVVGVRNGEEAWGSCLPSRWGPLPLRQTQRSPEGPRHLHRIPRLSEGQLFTLNRSTLTFALARTSGHVQKSKTKCIHLHGFLIKERWATQIWVIYTYYLTIPVLHQEPQLIIHSMRIIPCLKAK